MPYYLGTWFPNAGSAHLRNANYTNEVVGAIRDRLGPNRLMEFRRSCFGMFLDKPHLTFQGQVLFGLMLRMVDERGSGVLKFKFPSGEIEFGPKEFFMMTGLSFVGNATPWEKSSDIYYQYFPANSLPTLDNLEEVFFREAGRDSESLITYKLALLYLLYGALLNGGIKRNKPLDVKYVHAVENLTTFNAHPWGKEAYAFLAERMYTSWDKLKSSIQSKILPVVYMYGFHPALQTFFYETAPGIPVKWGKQLSEWYEVWPRIGRWTTRFSPPYRDVKDIFSDEAEGVYLQPQPSQFEETWIAQMDMEPPRIKTVAEHTAEETPRKRKFGCEGSLNGGPHVQNEKEGASPLVGQYANPPLDNYLGQTVFERIVVAQLSELTIGLSYMVTEYQELRQEQEQRKEQEKRDNEKFSKDFYTALKEIKAPSGKGTEKPLDVVAGVMGVGKGKEKVQDSDSWTDNFVKDSEDDDGDDWVLLPNKYTTEPPPSSFVGRTRPVLDNKRKETSVFMPYRRVGSSSKGKRIARDAVKFGRNVRKNLFTDEYTYDPVSNTGTKSMIDFQQWYTFANVGTNGGQLSTEMRAEKQIKAWRFLNLLDNQAWLSNFECDLVMNMMMHKAFLEPDLFRPRFCILDATAWGKLMDTTGSYTLNDLLPYVNGQEPVGRPIPWADADYIVGIANLKKKHRVAYRVDFDMEEIMVYDSLCLNEGQWEEAVKPEFGPLREAIPTLCIMGDVFAKQGRQPKNIVEWDVKWYRAAPQQTNSYDCGVMALKFVECLAAGVSVQEVNQYACSEYRKGWVLDAWKLKVEAQLNNIATANPAASDGV